MPDAVKHRHAGECVCYLALVMAARSATTRAVVPQDARKPRAGKKTPPGQGSLL